MLRLLGRPRRSVMLIGFSRNSMTIDTGCSGSLVGVDVACRYLSAGDVDSAIVAACNLFFRYVCSHSR